MSGVNVHTSLLSCAADMLGSHIVHIMWYVDDRLNTSSMLWQCWL